MFVTIYGINNIGKTTQVELLKEKVTETYWQNADGEMGEVDITSFVKRMDKDYKDVKKNILKSLGKK